MKSYRLSILAGVALAYCISSVERGRLYAGPLVAGQTPTITVRIEDSPTAPSWTHTPSAEAYRPANDQDGSYELFGGQREFVILGQRAVVEIQELQFDPDPFVLNNILVTNTTNATQIFSAFVGLPTTFPAPNLISGNVRTSVIDGGLDGATIATVPGEPLYQAQIDGVTVETLQDDPFSVTAPIGGSNTLADTFGPTGNAVPVNSNFGIQLRFTLTPGDTASILSRFDVVPEPTCIVLLGVGRALAASAAGRGRRS